jgi:hypothetical protein
MVIYTGEERTERLQCTLGIGADALVRKEEAALLLGEALNAIRRGDEEWVSPLMAAIVLDAPRPICRRPISRRSRRGTGRSAGRPPRRPIRRADPRRRRVPCRGAHQAALQRVLGRIFAVVVLMFVLEFWFSASTLSGQRPVSVAANLLLTAILIAVGARSLRRPPTQRDLVVLAGARDHGTAAERGARTLGAFGLQDLEYRQGERELGGPEKGKLTGECQWVRDRLAAGLGRVDETFAGRWEPYAAEPFTVIATTPADGDGCWLVDPAARTVVPGDPGLGVGRWRVSGIARVEAGDRGGANLGVAFRRGGMRYSDAGDAGRGRLPPIPGSRCWRTSWEGGVIVIAALLLVYVMLRELIWCWYSWGFSSPSRRAPCSSW